MGYYDYSHYFSNLISNQTLIINNLNNILLYLQVFILIFTIFFVWFLISRMIRRHNS